MEKTFDVVNVSELEFLVEKILDNNQFFNLAEILNILNSVYDNNDYDEDFSNHLYQIILFLDGIYLDSNDKNYKLAYENFIEALALTIESFDINNFENLTYNTFELRILMNIALELNKLEKRDLAESIYLFLLKNLDEKSQLYASVLHNLAILKAWKKEYKQALALVNRAIDLANKYRNSSKLHTSYYEKGIFEYRLGDENYKNSFELSKSLAIAYGHDDFLKFLDEQIEKYQ